MKKLLFVYDRMMTGGTTTALLSLLNELDYTKYKVDLILYSNEGPFLSQIPKQVRLLEPAFAPKLPRRISMRHQKIFFFLLDGGPFRTLFSFFRHRGTPKGSVNNIIAHQNVKTQVFLSRKLEEVYDVAIGFIEGWSDHYALSDKVRAHTRIAWIHPDYMASYLLPEADRKVLKRADHVVLVSPSCKDSFCRAFTHLQNKAVAIENITSQKLVQQRAESGTVPQLRGQLRLGTVCRCDMRVKGLDRVIRALTKLRDENLLEGVVWHLVGDGKDLPKVKEMAAEAKLQDYIVFHGHSDNPLPLVKQLDAFILASRYEGKPVAVTEALCLGVPCVVTEYASAAEQIAAGVNGLVVSNDDQGIYKAMKQILEDKSQLASLRNGAQGTCCSNTEEVQKFYAILRSTE